MITLLLACTSKGRPPPISVDATQNDTGTSSPPVTTGGPDARTFLTPSVRILVSDDLDVGSFVALLQAYGQDPATILINSSSGALFGDARAAPTMVLPGDLAPGDYKATEVWDGVSWIDETFPWNAVVNAGDVDQDGHIDLWYGDKLLRGPILGRTITWESEAFLATLDGEWAVAGNFDADGDGVLDVVTQHTNGNQAFVRYGPFSGPIPSARDGEADPATYSSLGESGGCQVEESARWLRDHLGPGHHAIAVGNDLELCTYDTFVWDPFVPRGTHRTYNEAIAAMSHFPGQYGDMAVHDPGDVDGDGHPDAIYEYQNTAQLIPGPVSGVYDTFTDFGFWDRVRNGYPARAMPDVTGDGAPEIVGRWFWTAPGSTEITHDTWVLMCSPFTFPLDFATGLPLVESHGGPWILSSFMAMDTADLDGDGLHDLVDTRGQLEPDGLSIWYGRDLAAACAAQRSATAN